MVSYVFSEIISLSFDTKTGDLEDAATALGGVWANTVKAYLESEHTGVVCWGVVDESPMLKLVVEWNTQQGYEAFRNSVEYRDLLDTWSGLVSILNEPILFHFSHRAGSFGDFLELPKSPLAIVTLKFPPGYSLESISHGVNHLVPETRIVENAAVPRTNRRLVCDAWWQLWGTIFYKRATSNDSYVSGWSFEQTPEHEHTRLGPIYCVSFPTNGAEAVKKILDEEKPSPQMKFLLSTATAGFEVEFAYMRRFDSGWHGSVTRTYKENKNWISDPVATRIVGEFNDPNSEHMRAKNARCEALMRARGQDPDLYKNNVCGSYFGFL